MLAICSRVGNYDEAHPFSYTLLACIRCFTDDLNQQGLRVVVDAIIEHRLFGN